MTADRGIIVDGAWCRLLVQGMGRRGVGEWRARGGGGYSIMHGRSSRMIIDPRTPTMPGRSTSVFIDHIDIACTKQEAPCGVCELHPAKKRL